LTGAAPAQPAHLKDLTRDELRALVTSRFGEPAYRGDQIFEWIYRHRAADFDAMSNLPAPLRERLAAEATLAGAEVTAAPKSIDGTRKLLLRLEDGERVEAVMIPDGKRLTLCVSTQVGCALACTFCATGVLGFKRNLRPGEVLDQILIADRYAREDAGERSDAGAQGEPPRCRITNLVLMGMGEPLLNAENTARALEILADHRGIGLGPRRVTLSTVGVTSRLWGFLDRTGVNLAVSLHAPEPTLRAQLMPIERAHPVTELLAEIRRRQGRGELRDRVTFEYVLLRGVNDAPEQARALSALVRGIHCKVNLLAFNPYPGSPYQRPAEEAVDRFRAALVAAGTDAYIRRSRGRDIAAACGQLALRRDEGAPISPLRRRSSSG
jgi:23S rRNA (adenine2503-C2)-methyltransferase